MWHHVAFQYFMGYLWITYELSVGRNMYSIYNIQREIERASQKMNKFSGYLVVIDDYSDIVSRFQTFLPTYREFAIWRFPDMGYPQIIQNDIILVLKAMALGIL